MPIKAMEAETAPRQAPRQENYVGTFPSSIKYIRDPRSYHCTYTHAIRWFRVCV